MQKNTIRLWYNNDAMDAGHFYANTFPDSLVGKVFQAPSDFTKRKQL
jgi:predicted 3-demethylubiquinone-9 3-methyltransferase (glyoxalase superfamily)